MSNKHIFQPKRILVTGGAGFIGANFIHYLLAADEKVVIINLDILTYAGNLAYLDGIEDESRYHFVKGDIGDQKLVHHLLRRHEIDTIVHFAAESHVDRSIEGPAIFIKTNLEGTAVLLEEARNYWLGECDFTRADCRYHQVSTDEVYGSLGAEDDAFTEQSNYAPNSPYSASKAGADHLVRSYWKTYSLPTTISCCSNNYGMFQHQEKLIPTVIRCCVDGAPIPVYGDGSNIRDWLFVGDHCRAIDLILRSGCVGETYNIGGNNEVSNIELIRHICKILDEIIPNDLPNGYSSLIDHISDRPGHDWRYAINSHKLQQELGWSVIGNFNAELEHTVKMYAGLMPMQYGRKSDSGVMV